MRPVPASAQPSLFDTPAAGAVSHVKSCVQPGGSGATQAADLAESGLFIGTCGFSYREWIGPFYPSGSRMSDLLNLYAAEFNCVEINSTFYGIPPPETTLKFARVTPPWFRFIIKANQLMTHDLTSQVSVFDEFKRCLAPLERSGKLAGILAQFPQRFHRTPEALDALRMIRRHLPDHCVTVELRHASWVSLETYALLEELGMHFCCVDEPALPGLMPAVRQITGTRCPHGPIVYVRFHGRNARQWHQHQEAWMRYDYLYSDDELKPWSDWLASSRSGHAVFALFNNHAQAKAVQDARRLRRLMGY